MNNPIFGTRLLVAALGILSSGIPAASARQFLTPAPASGSQAAACPSASCEREDPLAEARAYLIRTAMPGGTMVRQGPELAIGRLHPEFAKRLAAAIAEARSAGLESAGIHSAYRPPVFGVGGFADKFYSLHAYGLAVDMSGIGRAGSAGAQKWHEIAARHGIVCPYGHRNRAEWNHCQPTQLEFVTPQNPLRDTIEGKGPIDLGLMFHTGDPFIADPETVTGSAARVRHVSVASTADPAISRPPYIRGVKRASLNAAKLARGRKIAHRRSARAGRLPAKHASAPRRVAMVAKRAR